MSVDTQTQIATPQSIVIEGRRWFQKTYGNTYFSAVGIVDGEVKARIDFEYGYGEHYAHRIWEELERNGAIPPIERRTETPPGCDPVSVIAEAPWSYARRLGITLHYSASDVSRKKDL